MSKAKVIGAIIVVLAIAGAGAAFAITNARIAEVQVADVAREDLYVVVAASGEVEADSRVDVYPPTTGTIESVEVTEGAPVKAGQVIAVMDTAPIEVQVAQADAAYAAAQAQRNAISSTTPSAADRRAAQAAVAAAYSAYQIADAQYQAALGGYGAPTPNDIALAELAVDAAQAAVDAATSAYDNFYNNVYLPASEPREPAMEAALAALALARDMTTANLLTAQQTLNALNAASNNQLAVSTAKVARDQAYAAYLAAQAQTDALARASSVSGALTSADAALEAAASAKALADETLTKATIVAPIDGIVLFNSSGASLSGAAGLSALTGGSTSASSSGGTIGPGTAVSPGSAPFAIVSFDELAFTALVDETDVVRVESGMNGFISLDALPDSEFTAEVESVGKEAVTTPTGGTAFPVRLVFSAQGETVLLGMNGSIEIAIETIGDVVTMPIEALLEAEGVNYVFTVRDGRARRTEIEVGRLTDTRVEIRSGLSEGDQVIVSGVAELDDGTRVRGQ